MPMKPTTSQWLLNKVRADYNQIAEEFSHTRVYPWKEFDVFCQHLKENNNLLDIGCGNGRLNESLKNAKIYYNGIDNSTNLILEAQHKYPRQFFQVGDMLKMPFVNQEFDVALAIAVFHHIPSLDLKIEALNEVKRVLKSGGKLLMTNWNLHQPKYRWLILKNFWQRYMAGKDWDSGDLFIPWHSPDGTLQQKRYYHAFSLSELELLAEKTDWKIIEQYYSRSGEKSNSEQGFNIVSIWQKP